MPNRAEWLVVDFAVTLLGATLVPISTWSRPRELEYVLNHCDASTLVTVDRFLGQDYLATLAEMAPGSARLPRLRRVVALGGERRPGLRVRERPSGRHDPRRRGGAPGTVRGRRGTGPDRARALQRLLRRAEHRARVVGASRPRAFRSSLAPHGRGHRLAAGHADGDG